MSFTAEEFTTIQKSTLETALNLYTRSFDNVEKLLQLNVETAKAAFSDVSATLQAIVANKDPQDLVKTQLNALQPTGEQLVTYIRKASELVQAGNTEVAKLINDQVQGLQKQQNKAIETFSKNAPAGSEGLMSFVKSSISSAHNAMESTQKAVKQAAEIVQTNLETATTTASNFTKQSAKSK
jgi:phasin family protein